MIDDAEASAGDGRLVTLAGCYNIFRQLGEGGLESVGLEKGLKHGE